jgi:putative ABC transport system permease protein
VALEDPHSILFSETAAKKYFGSIAFLILIIACINYMNLATARSAKRAREVGMRKVLGASEPGIGRLLTREYIKKVLISSLVAWPLGYLAMSACLRNFICRAGLGTAPFILSGLGGLLVALLAVSYQTLKAASANPAVSLRYE